MGKTCESCKFWDKGISVYGECSMPRLTNYQLVTTDITTASVFGCNKHETAPAHIDQSINDRIKHANQNLIDLDNEPTLSETLEP